MNIELQTIDALSETAIEGINRIACLGFEQANNPAMLEDTKNHIQSAELVHLAYDEQRLIGFSLYRSYLWQ